MQTAERVQRLRFILERHAGKANVLARTGYSWVRQSPATWRGMCPDFPDWLKQQPRDPAAAFTKTAAEASESLFSDEDPDDTQ
jgi:hypothetical protein